MSSFQTGFGANAPNVQNIGVLDTTIRLIQTQPGTFARITAIAPTAIQIAGAILATLYMPIYVLRGSNLGSGPQPGQLQPSGALLPADTNLPGLPSVSQLTGNIELLFAQYVRVQNQGLPIDLDGLELYAANGQALAVVMSSLIDGTVAPPLISTVQAANVLTVLGVTGSVHSDDSLGFGTARSLPRFDIALSER